MRSCDCQEPREILEGSEQDNLVNGPLKFPSVVVPITEMGLRTLPQIPIPRKFCRINLIYP